MKRLILIFTAVLVLVLGIMSCTQVDQTDIPTYTADQVIYVASANSPDYNPETTSSWTAHYVGEGRWSVTKKCLNRLGGIFRTEQWYFYESNGQLVEID